jgi:transcriptional regulator with XRE-family HTH domain
METRIRELRKAKGWTLRQVADLVGTTAQTVQRLETANMTVSTDWLERFANAFSVRAVDLIRDRDVAGIPMYGRLGRDGAKRDVSVTDQAEHLSLTTPAQDPVAVRLSDAIGLYRAGSTLIGNRLANGNNIEAQGRDALVLSRDGTLFLGRIVLQDRRLIVVPISDAGPVKFDVDAIWIAPIVMEIRYL